MLTQVGTVAADSPVAETKPVQVLLEMRVLSVTESCVVSFGLDCDSPCKVNVQETQTGCSLPCQGPTAKVGLVGCTVSNKPACQASPCEPPQCKPHGFVNECCPKNSPTGQTPACDSVCDGTRVTVLTDCQVAKLLEAAQGDQRTNVLCAPKIMTLDGQAAVLNICQERHFVTAVDVFWNGDQVVGVPKSERYPLGLWMSAQPEVSADRSSVRVHVKANWTSLEADPVPVSPVMTMLTPIFECGAQGAPAPFTQFIQTPKITRLTVDKTLRIPDSGTVLLSGWTRKRQHPCEESVPVLGQIPLLNCLFKKDCQETETECVLLLITSRILKDGEESCRPPESCPYKDAPRPAVKLTPPPPAPRGSWQVQLRVQARQGEAEEQEHVPGSKERIPSANSTSVQGKDKKVAKLLAKYQRACAEGRLAEAQKLAGRALILDPACFSKSRDSEEQEQSSDDKKR
jgi:general secretion pathway protein D